MSERLTCYFSVMRYVPDVVRDESVNVGVLLFEPQSHLLLMRHLTNLADVRKFDSRVNLRWLKRHLTSFQKACERVSGKPSSPAAGMDNWTTADNPLQTLHEQFCNLIQFTVLRPVLTDDPQAEIERLYTRYVAPRKPPAKDYFHDLHLRQKVREVFAQHELLTEQRVQEHYEIKVRGDEIKFPLYYQNGRLNLINPISFAVENHDAKRDEVRRLLYQKLVLEDELQNESPHLLVVAHPPLSRDEKDIKTYQNCLEMLDLNDVEKAIVEQEHEESWQRLVERVRRDLGIRD